MPFLFTAFHFFFFFLYLNGLTLLYVSQSDFFRNFPNISGV